PPPSSPADQTASTSPPPSADATTTASIAAPAESPAAAPATVDANAQNNAPAAAPATSTTAPSAPSDMQATFAPSRAPALDASVAQYVPQPILSRYQQTAAAAAAPGVQGFVSTRATPRHRHHRKAKAAQTTT